MIPKLNVFTRSPNNFDSFTFKLFLKILDKIPVPSTAFYTHSRLLDSTFHPFKYLGEDDTRYKEDSHFFFKEKIENNLNTEIISIGIKDHLSGSTYEYTAKQELVEYLKELFKKYPNNKFILFTSLEFLETCLNEPNAYIVRWGGDIVNQLNEYKNVQPIIEKNFDSPYTYVSLNRHPRPHRHLAVALLHALNLEDKGLISWLSENRNGFHWQGLLKTSNLASTYYLGLDKFQQNTNLISDSFDIYPQGRSGNDNAFNFNNKLSNYYKNTFVEIVAETTFKEPTLLLTEKTQNAFMGCNFPIFISTYGTVAFLREMGLDMYDDIIDHSYDTITDPVERVYAAIYNNKELLSNNNNTKKLWKENVDRVKSNAAFFSQAMYDFYEHRLTTDFDKALRNLK
jgi:hypothetical protein